MLFVDCGCGLMVKWVNIIKSSILNGFAYFTEGYYTLENIWMTVFHILCHSLSMYPKFDSVELD